MSSQNCPITGESKCKCKYEVQPIEVPTIKEILRKLFTDHANYTHLYIISEIYQLPNLEPVTNRLLENQTDIGNAVKSVIGSGRSKKLIELLKEHIMGASRATKSAIQLHQQSTNINKSLFDQDVANFFANAEDVSELLGSIKPYILPVDIVETHFKEHCQLVLDLVGLYLEGKDTEATQEYDCYYTHILGFSDLLSLLS